MPYHLEVEFEPVSGLVFRDARPFQAGESSVARSLSFPPPPGAFFAAVERLVGKPVEVTGFALAQRDGHDGRSLFYPMPMDVMVAGSAGTAAWTRLQPRRTTLGTRSNSPFRPLDTPRGVVAQPCVGTFFSADQWRAYLSGDPPTGTCGRPAHDFCAWDVRTGTQLEGRRAHDGRLYSEQVVFLHRDPRVTVAMGIAAPAKLTKSTLAKVGGESKLTSARVAELDDRWTGGFDEDLRRRAGDALIRGAGPDGVVRARLCTLTPAIYSANVDVLHTQMKTPAWRPFWLFEGWKRLPGANALHEIRLVSATLGRASPVGFWDGEGSPRSAVARDEPMESGMPKPLYRAVPAGAVYFVEIRPAVGSSVESAVNALLDFAWMRSIAVTSDGRSTYFGRMGFGLAVVGGWDYV